MEPVVNDERGVIVRTVEAKSVIVRSSLPVCDFSANPYVGCAHACRYCYASFYRRRPRLVGSARP